MHSRVEAKLHHSSLLRERSSMADAVQLIGDTIRPINTLENFLPTVLCDVDPCMAVDRVLHALFEAEIVNVID